MKRINNYLNLPLPAQRALDRYWFAAEELQSNFECDKGELSGHFNDACEFARNTFEKLNLDLNPFFKPVNV